MCCRLRCWYRMARPVPSPFEAKSFPEKRLASWRIQLDKPGGPAVAKTTAIIAAEVSNHSSRRMTRDHIILFLGGWGEAISLKTVEATST